jgi:hypothetical protein
MIAEIFLIIGLVGLVFSILGLNENNDPKWRNVVSERDIRTGNIIGVGFLIASLFALALSFLCFSAGI